MSLERFAEKHITHKKLAFVIAALCVIIIIQPLFLPLTVSSIGQDFYDQVQTLEPGDIVMIAGGLSPGGFNTARSFYKAMFNSIAERGAKFVMWSVLPEFQPLIGTKPSEDRQLQYCEWDILYDFQYGIDYAYLPYAPGEETAMAAVAADIHATFSTDAYGTPLNQVPLLSGLHSLSDFDLAIFGAVSYTVPEMFVRQWPAKYGIPTITWSNYQLISAYYGKYILGCLDSTTGMAEMEYLTRTPGEYILRMDVRNVNVILTFILIAIGNIVNLQRRRRSREAT